MSQAAATSKPLPPPPPPKQSQIKVFRALHDYVAQRECELSFSQGDLIYVTDMVTDNDWWKAKSKNKDGLVARTYVEENTENVFNPMHDAAKRGNSELIEECLQNNVSVNSLDKTANTPLHWACYGGHTVCVELLLKAPKVDVDVQNRLGDTPLHNASCKNRSDVIELLLAHGARTDVSNQDEKTPDQLTTDARCRALIRRSMRDKQEADQNNYLDNQDQSAADDDNESD